MKIDAILILFHAADWDDSEADEDLDDPQGQPASCRSTALRNHILFLLIYFFSLYKLEMTNFYQYVMDEEKRSIH